MKTIMAALDSSPNVNTIPSSSFASAWQTFCSDFFLEMQGNLQDFLQSKLTQVIVYWGSSAAAKKFTAAGAALTLKALQAKQANLAANVVIQRGFIA
jgi:anaerobic selenocysteine-containing dehydrogenase